MVELFQEDVDCPSVDVSVINNWFNSIVDFHNYILGDVSIILCSDDYLLEINKEYLNHDYYTDIITFDYSGGINVSGDLFISWDRVVENAMSYNVAPLIEFYRVCAHGLLHLLGYKDKCDEDVVLMREKEDWALSLLNVSRETL